MNDDAVSLVNNLIFDVGMHQGEDTEYYLKRGFKVIAIEANPELVQDNKKIFSQEIARGDLIIVEGAIVDDQSLKTVKFYVNEDSSVWGTVVPDFAERNEQLGTRNKIVEVNAIDFKSCLRKHGIPYFMKIDIEGADLFCLKSLESFSNKPTYLSIESDKVSFEKLLIEIELLERLGYSSFKAVQQADVPKMRIPLDSCEGKKVQHIFTKEASGMFGSDLPGKWLTKKEIVMIYQDIFTQYRQFGDNTIWQKNSFAQTLLKALSRITGNHYPGWYDTHARHHSITTVPNAD